MGRRVAVVLAGVMVAATVALVGPGSIADAGEPPRTSPGSRGTVGTVRGTVTAADTGLPLADACVELHFAPPSDATYRPEQRVRTAADGSYEALVRAGRYLVAFEPDVACSPLLGHHVGELYDDTTEYFDADVVVVTAGGLVDGIDAALSLPSHITGIVTSDEGGAPIEGVCISAYMDAGYGWSGGDRTGADGRYDIGGLPKGDYTVRFRDCTLPFDFVPETFDDDPGDLQGELVTVEDASTTVDIDAGLATAGHITGRLTDDATGEPIVGGYVYARREGPTWDISASQDAGTGPDGTYDIGGLPAGNYRVGFGDNPGRYGNEEYDDIHLGNGYDPVVLGAGVTVTGIDAGLRPACDGRAATVDLQLGQVPTEGEDVIRGTEGDDVIHGLGGDDQICGYGGNDQIRGGGGFERLFGGDGDDLLVGGADGDSLMGGAGIDDCRGGRGVDYASDCETVRGVP